MIPVGFIEARESSAPWKTTASISRKSTGSCPSKQKKLEKVVADVTGYINSHTRSRAAASNKQKTPKKGWIRYT